MAGVSIPAAEHSTITSWGRDHEVDAYRNMLEQYPTGIMACVSDSYDIEVACRDLWGSQLRDQVLARDGVLVVRPDSGYPPKIVLSVLGWMGEAFGAETNAKGYRVLHPKVRVIQGDGCTPDMIQEILHQMQHHGWSADNIAFGMGGGLLQKCDRDTYAYAFKCSAVRRGGAWQDVYKDPKTDAAKASKRGRLALVQTNDGPQTMLEAALGRGREDLLQTVFEDGRLKVRHEWDSIRERAALPVTREA